MTEGPRALCEKFHPEARMLVAYIPCWPFEAEICETCGEPVTYWGPVKDLIWKLFIGWWWDGSIKVYDSLDFPKERRRS